MNYQHQHHQRKSHIQYFIRFNLLFLILFSFGAKSGHLLLRADYIQLDGEARKNHEVLSLSNLPIHWMVGDLIIIPGDKLEIKKIDAINGTLIYLDSKLEYDHGDLQRLPIVINLSKIKVLRNE